MSLISDARLLKNLAHNQKIQQLADKQGEVGFSSKQINGEKWYSCEDRYRMKMRDPSKSIFCLDPQLSKEYENLIKANAHLIYPDAEIFFVKDQ